MDLLGLLARALEMLTSWLPRPLLVPRYQRAVVWILGRAPRALHGLLVVIPLLETVEEYDLRFDATTFNANTLWTKDGQEVALGMVLVWRVADPLKTAETVNDLEELVAEIAESVLPELVGLFTLDELRRKIGGGEDREWSFNAHLTSRARKLLEPYGCEVDYARVNFSASRPRTLNLMQF